MTRPELNEDFVDVLACMRSAEVEFLIVGAHALAVHGIVRATGDIDILVRPSAANARRVVAALREFGAPLEAHGVSEADFERLENVYQIGLPPRRIDVLTSISGVDFDEAWASRISASLGDQPVFVLGRDALIRNKRSAGRPKDLWDADALSRDG